MSNDKFFNDDMQLAALLDGRWAEKPQKPHVFDPIYGPTSFTPHTVTIAALYERQICACCKGESHAFLGLFTVQGEGSTKKYQKNLTNDPPEYAEESVTTIPVCFACFSKG